ncbi:acyl-CoA thioesterase II [Chondromyces apiculatus]|uniref:Acyl-CoA thioesterase 2 n=1 Tax=Chondromyces apiculatus DSM 436 TaxID=1192034 RepID=A0A017T2U0_9BACT|nr:acyl-CoA thioesterase II [Chondromyces apiculatus]EYF03327.1 Acyl-CoA thioesterase II [Chondromyces apiculatus DSM 436]
MSTVLQELVQQLALERLEENLFRGHSHDIGSGRVFGGQVLGQALSAAVQTVPPERHVHSIQAYFLRPGDLKRPIIYDVDRIRDGTSFTTRRVVAIQHGKPIFNMAASFQLVEEGFEHQDPMPKVSPPETFPTEREIVTSVAGRLPRQVRERALAERPFEVRPIDPDTDLFMPEPRPPTRSAWLRAAARLPDDPGLHRYLLLYASDYAFITTALRPHGVTWLSPGMQVASLDHAMWFHRPFRVDEWLLHVFESPTAHGARGLARGRVFTQDGRLIASTVQEGLIRQRAPQP